MQRIRDDMDYPGQPRRPGFTYLLSWPVVWGGRIVKAGCTDYPSRWRKFLRRGAELHALWQGPESVDMESELLRSLETQSPLAFETRDESRRYLGDGCGWLECYYMTDEQFSGWIREVGDDLV